MSKQSDEANRFARKKMGAAVDKAAGAAGLRVLKDGESPDSFANWVKLPGIGDQHSAFARELGQHLADKPFFRRENLVVTVNQRTGALDMVSADRFRTLVENFVVTYKSYWYSPKPGQPKIEGKDATTMTKECAACTLSADVFLEHLRDIARVNLVRMPVLRDDGRIELLKDGYDEESQTYTLTSEVPINEKLTPEEGVTMLRDYLKEFPFSDDRSLAVAVTEMVALYVFGLQELTANRGGFIYKANKERIGKSLAAQFGITAPYGLPKGQTISNQEEMKKLLDATALQGTPYVFFDNLTGHVKSNLLESFMTTPVWTGRVMGTQKTFDAPKGTIVIITGNNITASADISGRCLLCVLYSEDADPQARKLTRILTPQFLARPKVRGDILSALWAMVRGWDEKKRPGARRRFAGFEEWSDLVGGIVLAAGFTDPFEKPKDEEAANTSDVDARVLVKELADAIPEGKKAHEYTFQDLVDVCYEFKCFDWKLDGKLRKDDKTDEEWFECNKASQSALGKIFNEEMAAQIFTLPDGRRVRFGKRGQKRHKRFMVEIVPADQPKA